MEKNKSIKLERGIYVNTVSIKRQKMLERKIKELEIMITKEKIRLIEKDLKVLRI